MPMHDIWFESWSGILLADVPSLLAFDWTAAFTAIAGILVGGVAGAVALKVIAGSVIRAARQEAETLRSAAHSDAESTRQKAELDAERAAKDRKAEVDREAAEARAEIKTAQDRISKREDTLDEKLDRFASRESAMDKRQSKVQKREDEIVAQAEAVAVRDADITARLSEVADLSQEDAKVQLLERVGHESEEEAAAVKRGIIEAAESDAKRQSREITIMAIQRFAAEHVAESTVRSVKIPSDDLKGRIIGREGRNIRAIERATGADVLVDDTPGVISVSCFDPIRRAIAGESLARLVADGRVHPSRVEEIVANVKSDMEEQISEKGNEAVMEAKMRGLHPKIVEAMGKLHFRTSFGQNVLRHSMEVAYLSQVIADQLGLDGSVARRCGFLHDIGKAMDHEMEGGHPAIGMEFAKRFGETREEVLNAIGGHHGDIPSTSPYTPIVMAADAVSGARPGARRESMELYIQRLKQLEDIAYDSGSVREAYAIQAGREVRVIVDSGRVNDDEAFIIADKIARKVEDEMTFPGEIKVTVLRETRAEATAR
ncbi:MAG: ribonuclease Y [Phycisphaerales bacterium]|mgnify:CR=1 FL=1|jgi:ribonuclease Y|nr:ribonuclease Y [Phycisphaerales bacterium]MDP6312406.1 ribonuclease Y [Phycisphaerales bacterium]MDP7087301.1 ribonuclease Y [Phycisphaerales bacterium]MDP7520050.1 ribonuclease Y [Phycisphaerales bacterium]HCA38599.1 ribonuclease Y [Phycisphaerales bacterium]|tara:strand:- start:359 stop:1993 length:1635 start_codon:yes stop_codon:yes gene_type:complete